MALRHQPRIQFPAADHVGNPCSLEMANSSSADESIAYADFAPPFTQAPSQARYNVLARMWGDTRRASASASSCRNCAWSTWPRQSNVSERNDAIIASGSSDVKVKVRFGWSDSAFWRSARPSMNLPRWKQVTPLTLEPRHFHIT